MRKTPRKQSQHLEEVVYCNFLLIADADSVMPMLGWLGSQQNASRSVSAISSVATLKLPTGLAGRQARVCGKTIILIFIIIFITNKYIKFIINYKYSVYGILHLI